MKVLYSCLSQSWGGMEMFTITAVKQLLKRNIQTELLCFPESRLHKMAEENGIKVHLIKAKSYFHPSESLKLMRIITHGKFDLIHSQASKDLWVIVPALKFSRSKTPLFLTKQVGSFIKKKDFLHKFIYNRINITFAISKVIEKNLIDTTPLDKSKIRILHNGVDTKYFNPLNFSRKNVREEFGIKNSDILIGMLARFSWGKGHEEFINAAKLLSKKHKDIKFLVVGEASRGEESYENKIRLLADDINLNDKIIFTGFRKDTPNVLSALDIFAFPSHSEAFGIALVEAMSIGIPSVCSNTDGILDIADDGETSFLFQKQNFEDLAEKLELLINSEEIRKSFGKAARKRAEDMFDLEYLTDKVINYYKELLRNSD